MFKMLSIFFPFLLLFANKGKALKAESICCKEMESSLENKTTSYQTVCLGKEGILSSKCCKIIEIEIEKQRYAYKTLCPAQTELEPLIARCNIPLGIENGSISDVAVTSSTILNASSLPHFGRLKGQLGDCAWMPAMTADQNSSWLQVDLGRLINVSAVATQGSCSGAQWTESYVIVYSKNNVDSWTSYGELGATKVFIGNTDSTSIVTNYFTSSFEARFVRISPRSWHKNVALRMELFTDCHSVLVDPNPQTPRTCLDHLKNGLKTNGYYNIYDVNSNLITVYCDMTSEPGKAWTLVMSFATSNKHMTEFRSKPFFADAPVDESFPNWMRYRMSLTTMNDLSTQSTHWRATCNFPVLGVDNVDYLRGKFSNFDVVNFHGGNVCKRVEYVNIRGHQCSDCNVQWWQDSAQILHTSSVYTTCGFDARPGAASSEENFGHYSAVNSNFRCTANPSATTNWWFGGNAA